MITAGIDMGTQTVKVVILKDGHIAGRSKVFSGFDPSKASPTGGEPKKDESDEDVVDVDFEDLDDK